MSLYLAAGLPVIIWSEAAQAEFVIKEGVGFTVNSLSEIPKKLQAITKDNRVELMRNVDRISHKVRAGFYTRKALDAALKLAFNDN